MQDSVVAQVRLTANYKRASRSVNSSVYDLRKLIRSRQSSAISSACTLPKENATSLISLSKVGIVKMNSNLVATVISIL